MDWIRETAVSVITAALICAVLTSLLPRNGAGELVRLLCGVFLAVTVLSQLRKSDLPACILPAQEALREGTACAEAGKAQSDAQLASVIKQACEAYILDKAAQLEVQITPRVQLSREEIPVPVSVTVQGAVSREDRAVLEDMLERDLGISKEAQRWIG